jgi:hypothetical protein
MARAGRTLDPIELVINASVDREYRFAQSCRAGAGYRQAAYLRKGARLWSARATRNGGVTEGAATPVGVVSSNAQCQVDPEGALKGAPSGRPAVVVAKGLAVSRSRARARRTWLRGAERPVVVVGVARACVLGSVAAGSVGSLEKGFTQTR